MEAKSSTTTTLPRRNSIGTPTLPTKLILPATNPKSSSFPQQTSSSFPAVDFELISLSSSQPSYTSLKDLLPSPVINSPTTANSSEMISIRNRLVKQAAWAYLQPMSASPDSSHRHFFRRISAKCFLEPLTTFLCFICHRIFPAVTCTLNRILRPFRFR